MYCKLGETILYLIGIYAYCGYMSSLNMHGSHSYQVGPLYWLYLDE